MKNDDKRLFYEIKKWDSFEIVRVESILTANIRSLKNHTKVKDVEEMRKGMVYYWFNDTTKKLTHSLIFEGSTNLRYIQDIFKQIKKGVIWKKKSLKTKNLKDTNQMKIL